jgi:hypothetical protein
MKSLAGGLPPEIAQQTHPDWRKNEAAYWAVRDQLLSQYQGQWIGFADGRVIIAGMRPLAVFQAACQAAEHPYVICVGREDQPCLMRRSYDESSLIEQGRPYPLWSPDHAFTAAAALLQVLKEEQVQP